MSTLHWQPSLEGEGIVEGVEDVRQCIRIILETPLGSDPLRPDFGSNLRNYVDHPIDRARPHVVRETVEAIRKWEPRCTVKRVLVRITDFSGLLIQVYFKLANGVEQSVEVYPYASIL
ncbi:baseplate protein [bacterium (Candidatus Blackallbacteria) CG13_big_fil_rev_8_21_14_2_50_49_14]|nr:MAG: baseplate protein [bacterium (Candidatus Blackallbacteria) CG18_big_fil_WC_8_21_14_2_50_49_26]PIW46655.1 MAG: baseplate protein [bacterium (Candidatus Blackallbacteria) CG13_big_fil_rev_8_21_14_2_50_49_14]